MAGRKVPRAFSAEILARLRANYKRAASCPAVLRRKRDKFKKVERDPIHEIGSRSMSLSAEARQWDKSPSSASP